MDGQGRQSGSTTKLPLVPHALQGTEEDRGILSTKKLEAPARRPEIDDSQATLADDSELSPWNKGKKRKAIDSGITLGDSKKRFPSSLAAMDNFCTPENQEFYDKRPYSQLDILNHEIRLIQLLPTKENEPLQAKLISGCFLDSDIPSHKYCAVSYCAGDPKDMELIKVNGFNFNAFASLGAALRQILRARQGSLLGGYSDLIWADQICINQSDPQERSQQVGLMKKIFETATEVLVCLGEDTHNGLWVEMLIQLCESIKVEEASRLLNHIPPVEFKDTAVWIGNRFLDDCKNSLFRAKWEAFKEIVDHPWWGRGWIYQEVIVSDMATLLFGLGRADFDHFSKAAQVAHEIFATHLRAVAIDPDLLKDHASVVIISAIRGFDSAKVASLTNGRSKWKKDQALDLKQMLEHCRQCKVSDCRDRVFAFIGLSDPGYDIVPDYTADVQVIFCQTCRRIVLHERSLAILLHRHETERQPALPSWVPDWSSETSGASLSASRMRFQASSDYHAAAAFDSNELDNLASILRVQCLILDQVADEGGMGIKPESLQESESKRSIIMDDWARVAGGEEMLDLFRAVAPSDNDKGKDEETGAEVVETDDKDKEIGEEDDESDQVFWKPRGEYFNGELMFDAFFSSLHLGTEATDLDSSILLAQSNMDGSWVFFRSPRGYIGLADSRALATDYICILLGAPVPFILRRQGNHYMLIGEAYVHGVMYGEAIEMMRDGSLENTARSLEGAASKKPDNAGNSCLAFWAVQHLSVRDTIRQSHQRAPAIVQ